MYTVCNYTHIVLFIRVGDSGTSSFSNIEIADHYAVCIKLSAENVSPHCCSVRHVYELYLLVGWL